MENKDNRFYVYVYLDPRKPGKYVYGEYSFDYEPFYIGKGSKDRYRHHLYDSVKSRDNMHKFNKINKIKKVTGGEPIISIVKNKLYEDKALAIEIELISMVGRKDLKQGPLVNMNYGGNGFLSGEKNPNFGKTPSDEERIRMRNRVSGKNNPMYGKKPSQKNLDSTRKPVIQFSFPEGLFIKEWPSEVEALKKVNAQHISSSCHSNNMTSGGFIWKFKKNFKKLPKRLSVNALLPYINYYTRNRRKVLQYSLKGSFIKEYESINEASKQTGGKSSSIGSACAGKNKTAINYLWKFKTGNKITKQLPLSELPKNKDRTKEILQYTMEGDFIKKHSSLTDAMKQTGVSYQHISKVCRGMLKTSGGFIWRYNSNKFKRKLNRNETVKINIKNILQYDLNFNFIKKWRTSREIQRATNFSRANVVRACKGKYNQAYGFIWRYAEDVEKNGNNDKQINF